MDTNTQPTVSTYDLTAATGRHIRQATQVTFPDGRVIRFMEKMSRRDALRQVTSEVDDA